MSKHFEHLWEDAEAVVQSYVAHTGEDPLQEMHALVARLAQLDDDQQEERQKYLGALIFRLTLVSQRHKLNAYRALREAINDAKIEILDPD